MRMQLTATLAGVLALVGYTHAATCSSTVACVLLDGFFARTESQYWAREQFCGGDRWKNTKCGVYRQGAEPFGPVRILISQPGANNQQVCWDALDNIIKQCGGSGSYSYNGVTYTMYSCSIEARNC